tara:strand:- start:339 stop:716 length:378 start_codon:yes stop_codon:yes gene_type:complete
MLQVTEEYVDGGYVYTVKDTDKYDAQMQEQLDTKATCLAEPEMIGAIVGLEELKCSLFEEANLPISDFLSNECILTVLKDWDEEQVDTVSYDELVEKISGLNLYLDEKGKKDVIAVLDNHFGKFI